MNAERTRSVRDYQDLYLFKTPTGSQCRTLVMSKLKDNDLRSFDVPEAARHSSGYTSYKIILQVTPKDLSEDPYQVRRSTQRKHSRSYCAFLLLTRWRTMCSSSSTGNGTQRSVISTAFLISIIMLSCVLVTCPFFRINLVIWVGTDGTGSPNREPFMF